MSDYPYYGDFVWAHRGDKICPARVVWFRPIIICESCETDCGDEPHIIVQFADGTESEMPCNRNYQPENLNVLELMALEF